jgi:GH25 family lysozyme M1 (1,4-beta-N-acetylmuramidase)
MNPKIVDINQWTVITDWNQAMKEVDGFILRASWSTYKDPSVTDQLHRLIDLNARIGLYHFYQPSVPSNGQIEAFLNVYKPSGFKLMSALDSEEVNYKDSVGRVIQILPPNPDIYTGWLNAWLSMVEKETSVVPYIYTRASFWNPWVRRSVAWRHNPLWVANYGVTTPALPIDWTTWSMWQYSMLSRYTWADGAMDTSWFNGTLAMLDKVMPRPSAVPVTPVSAPAPTSPVFQPYAVRLNGQTYALTIRKGPGLSYLAVSATSYLINHESERGLPSVETYMVLEVSAGWGCIAAGWINLANTIKA